MTKRKTKTLKDHHRAFLVKEFACFSSPAEAVNALKEEFGVEISPQGAQHYDATSSAGRQAAKKWHELFDVAREAFLEHVETRIPHAHKAVRIRKLARAADTFEQHGNYVAMASMLEKVAKELGNAYTNRFEHTGKSGGPIQYQPVDTMSEEQVDEELRQYGFDPDLHRAPARKQ